MTLATFPVVLRCSICVAVFADPGPPEEDELYEMYMAETNKVFRVQDDTLVPLQEYWGCTPKHEMLNSNEVYGLCA